MRRRDLTSVRAAVPLPHHSTTRWDWIANRDCTRKLESPRGRGSWLVVLVLFAFATTFSLASPTEYLLTSFGPVKTPVEVEATLKAAITSIIAQGGGILVITPGVAPNWVAHNDAPSSTKDRSPSVTIVDRRNGREKILVPSNGQRMGGSTWTGRYISREVRQPIDMAMGVHSTESIDTFIAGGTTSYDQQSLEAVKAGENARIYVPTIRGLAVSNQIVVTGVAVGYGGQFESGPIKALGWDKEKGRAYIVMDLKHDHPKSALVYGKHVVNSLTLTDHSQSDNQSPCLMVKRKNYAQGDSFVIAAEACSQGNIMSGAGDEGGLTYASDISNDLRPFRSTVEVINWDQQELVYAPGLCRNHTLGTSRPVINLNTNKWITQGVAYLVSPGYRDPWHPDQVLSLGGVFGSKDCGWTRDIVGRFFAFDEPSEYLDPKNDPSVGYTAAPDMRVYRWYQVHKIEDHAVGIKRIYLERTRWWVHYYVPSLYNTDNWSYAPQDGKNRLKPLHYIIAPGAYVSDVSCAWTDSYGSGGRVEANNPRTLKLAPTPDIGTRFDFEKGDPIVQAIGSDPWNVTGLRVRHFNYLPSTLPDSSLQAVNQGRVAVDSALGISGGGGDLKEIEAQKDKRPRFRKGIDIIATTGVGIRFGADVKEAAIRFEQPHNRAQPIIWWWHADNHTAQASLTVDPQTGEFGLHARSIHVPTLAVEKSGGISAGDKPAHNLRGVSVTVKKDATERNVRFDCPEADANYALTVQPSWITATAVVAKKADGFIVQFKKPAPRQAKVDWLLVR